MIKRVCSTCKHEPSDEHCKGCIFDWKNANGNTNWEPCDCLFKSVDGLIEKLKEKSYSESAYGVDEFDASKVIQLSDAIEIIEDYCGTESEDKEE